MPARPLLYAFARICYSGRNKYLLDKVGYPHDKHDPHLDSSNQPLNPDSASTH